MPFAGGDLAELTELKAKHGTPRRTRLGDDVKDFTDAELDLSYWFPLLAGLSELTFDARRDIRRSALEVLFDILKFHGDHFSPGFWAKVYESILMPIFDHVRAEVGDGEVQGVESPIVVSSPKTPGSSGKPPTAPKHRPLRDRNAEVDAWLRSDLSRRDKSARYELGLEKSAASSTLL